MALEWFDSLTDSLGKLGTTGANIYNTIKGAGTSEEEAYLRGQLTAIQAQSQYDSDKNTVKIGDMAVSTSSILWIIGGTLGLIAVGLGIKNLVK